MGYKGTVLLCGNPNVGKSTIFNRMTGLRRHTGNWPGKTVGAGAGDITLDGDTYRLVDLPGCYSLCSRSGEEECARDRILFGDSDVCVVVCDATCLSRGLILVLQILEVTGRVVVCINLMDEAKSRGITIDARELSSRLGVPVCTASAADGTGMKALFRQAVQKPCTPRQPLRLPEPAEQALKDLSDYLSGQPLPEKWLARALAEGDEGLCSALAQRLCLDPQQDMMLSALIAGTRSKLDAQGISSAELGDLAAETAAHKAEELAESVVKQVPCRNIGQGRRPDRVFAHPVYGVPAMLLLLAVLLWLTVRGANVPSELLSRGLFAIGDYARAGLTAMGLPDGVISALVDGVWRTTAWVIAVMLPPMAIFFPLFTFFEDLGYLPRVAFHLDGPLSRCSACGKQGLTMCMGLGCNAAGVTGCRIIDSPRERLIAILTNGFLPCNGRFPMLITWIGLLIAGPYEGIKKALALTAVLCLGVACTFLASALLGKTLLKGTQSSFALELPPYRKPRVGQILLRSLLDRTVFVLGRALLVAAPAGLIIWLLANIQGGVFLQTLRWGLEPAGQCLGMDGALLLAFILALPANEIVIPIALMIYTAASGMVDCAGLWQLWQLLSANGWTKCTVLCVTVFTLLHWPCGTTLLTVRKETGSWKWTGLAAALPTAFGVLLCALLRWLSAG